MKHITFLTGRTCTGKTTWANGVGVSTIHGVNKVKVISTSAAALGVADYAQMSKDTNAAAPVIAESAVRQHIMDSITSCEDDAELIIDSFPRSVEQIEFVENVARDHNVRVLYAVCAPDLRRGRIEKRARDETRKSLQAARLETEPRVFSELIEELMRNTAIPTYVLDLSLSPAAVRPLANNPTDFGHVYEKHAELNDEFMTPFSMSTELFHRLTTGHALMPPMSDAMVWCRRYMIAMRNEVSEALEEIPEEWWTIDEVSLAKLREELIDVFHFFMSSCQASGMTAKDVVTEYFRKRSINLARARSKKYSKRNKHE